MARVKGPPNKSGETKGRFELSPANDGERTKESKSIKLLHLPCSNLVHCLSIVRGWGWGWGVKTWNHKNEKRNWVTAARS